MKRYDLEFHGGAQIVEDVDGDYVLYSDHIEAMKRIAGAPVAQGLPDNAVANHALMLLDRLDVSAYDDARLAAPSASAQQVEPVDLDGCTEENCRRCRTQKALRTPDMFHAGISSAADDAAFIEQGESVASTVNGQDWRRSVYRISEEIRILATNLPDEWLREEFQGFAGQLVNIVQMPAAPAPTQGTQEPVARIRTWTKANGQHAELIDWEAGSDALPDGEHYVYAAPALVASPAAPILPPAFVPSDWVMEVAGVVVKLDEWEPGAVKARDFFRALAASPADQWEDARQIDKQKIAWDAHIKASLIPGANLYTAAGIAVEATIAAMSASAQQAVRAFSKDVCADDVYERGQSIGLFDIPKETANAICTGITAATGARVDWHYVGGRVHMKALAAPAPSASPAALTGWYCAHCKRGVDASEVTYNEQHTICGRVITDDDPPPAKQTAEAAELVRLWEAQSHIDAIAWGNRATDLLRVLAASPADQGEDARNG